MHIPALERNEVRHNVMLAVLGALTRRARAAAGMR